MPGQHAKPPNGSVATGEESRRSKAAAPTRSVAAGTDRQPSKASPGRGKKKAAQSAGIAPANKWFEKGEATELFQSILKRPMRFADLMARVVTAKRQAQLPKADMARFRWAVEAAVKKAVKAKAIVRRGDGMIVAATAGASTAGKAPPGSKKKA
jgi:hypothetical protein